MKTVEIENRTKVLENDHTKRGDFFMVDLIIDGEKIETGNEPISSHEFWKDMGEQSQRALHRIEKNNPKMSFDFNLSTLGMSEEEKNQRFVSFIKNKYPDVDVDKIISIIDKEVSSIELTGPDDNHPNPFMKFPIGSQMMKNFIIVVIDKFVKEKQSEQVG
ncbi:MAG: hypothetical protein AABY15_01925 [Nanoarchaeota archaeon]